MKSRAMAATLMVFIMQSSAMPGIARADDEQTRRQVFEQARAAMQAGQWEDARAFYQQLWGERHTYDVALQLGLAEYNLKRIRDAAEHLAYGLMLLPPREKAETAERSEQILGLCKQAVGTVDLRVKNKGADVIVDGKLVATSPLVTEVFVDPGEHRFEVRLDGHTSDAFTLHVDAGQTKTRSVALKPLVASAENRGPIATSTQPALAGDSRSTGSSQQQSYGSHASWTPVLAGGLLTLVGISAGIGFALVRNARENESVSIRGRLSRNECASSTSGPTDDCSRLSEVAGDYDKYGKLELASLIVGSLAFIGSSTYFLVTRPDRVTPGSAARLGPLQISTDISTHSGQIRVKTDF